MATPGWKTAISKALEKDSKSIVVQLSTIETHSSLRNPIPIPKVRSIIFRSFLTPSSTPTHPLILSTTDIRSPKVQQIFTNPKVELAWWIDGTQEQFRVSGTGCIVPAPPQSVSVATTTSTETSDRTDGDPIDRTYIYESFTQFVQSTRSGTQTSGGGLASLVRENFDWEKKRIEVFKTMSGHMKASWCRPVPGSPLAGGEDEAKKWPEKVEEPKEGDEDSDEESRKNRRNWETALKNFALLLVDPIEVDYVELGVLPNRRTKFWRTEEGEWEEMALVP